MIVKFVKRDAIGLIKETVFVIVIIIAYVPIHVRCDSRHFVPCPFNARSVLNKKNPIKSETPEDQALTSFALPMQEILSIKKHKFTM